MNTTIRKDEVLRDEQLDGVTGGAPEYMAYLNAAKATGRDISKIRIDGILGVQIIDEPSKK